MLPRTPWTPTISAWLFAIALLVPLSGCVASGSLTPAEGECVPLTLKPDRLTFVHGEGVRVHAVFENCSGEEALFFRESWCPTPIVNVGLPPAVTVGNATAVGVLVPAQEPGSELGSSAWMNPVCPFIADQEGISVAPGATLEREFLWNGTFAEDACHPERGTCPEYLPATPGEYVLQAALWDAHRPTDGGQSTWLARVTITMSS